MRYINVDDDFVGKILAANQLATAENLTESQEVEVVEEAQADEHVCPLCESELEHPIPEENMQECVDFILGTINEALEQDGEYLEESDDEDFEEDLDEAEEEDEDKDEDEDDDKPAFLKKKDKKKD
jgi:hypothetical protein